MSTPTTNGTAVNGPLSDASVDRLACLLRHWTWADEAMARFDRELDHSLLPPLRLDAIRQDVEASLPGLRVCRELLTVIPASLEEQPRIADLLHDDNLSRLRRIHRAFGEALLQERSSREIDSLDV